MMMRMAMHSPSATARSVQLSRSEIIAKHEQTRLQLATQPYKYTISSIDSKSPGYCDKPLDELRSIKIAELKVDTVHVGRVLTCRTVTSPLKYSATVTVVEDLDNSDTVLPLYIYNDLAYTYNGTKSSQELFDLLPPGTVLKIKEPYCKTGASGYKTIRVDEPHNVVQLSKRLEGLGYTTCQQYRSFGDSCYTSKNYESAVAAYDEALKIKPGDSQSLLNRASALSAIGKHHHALDRPENHSCISSSSRQRILCNMPVHASSLRVWTLWNFGVTETACGNKRANCRIHDRQVQEL
jgi:tetratricopeptide (TPR) repeat protein